MFCVLLLSFILLFLFPVYIEIFKPLNDNDKIYVVGNS